MKKEIDGGNGNGSEGGDALVKERIPKKLLKEAKGKGMEVKVLNFDPKKFLPKEMYLNVELKGRKESSLIVNQFGEKSREEMATKRKNKDEMIAAMPAKKRTPFEHFLGSLYLLDESKLPKGELAVGGSWPFISNTFGFPASAFDQAMQDAVSEVEGMTKACVKKNVFVEADLLPIKYEKLCFRRDIVRVGLWSNRQPDLRYRGEFVNWSVVLPISYNANKISAEQLAMLLTIAGFSIGVGEWRPASPKKKGMHGRFEIAGA